jgi:hypothetical protein
MFNQYDSVENRNTKGAIKPTPAEILKGNPLIHKIILRPEKVVLLNTPLKLLLLIQGDK